MGKRTWNEAIKTALLAHSQAYRFNNYVYLYGAKGIYLGSEAQIKEFFKMEPEYFSRYSNEELTQIIRNSLNRTAYDCSGFVGWLCTGDRQYSTGQINNCSYTTKDLASGVAGSILYTTYGGTGRHIGLDIGYGFCCDMACESTDANIKAGKVGVRLYKINDGTCPWEISGMSNVLDYTGADAR